MRRERGVDGRKSVDKIGRESCFVRDGILVSFEKLIQERSELLQVNLEVNQMFMLELIVGKDIHEDENYNTQD